MNLGLTSHQQRGHTETGHRFKVSSERPEKQGIDLATPGLVVQRVIHYTTAAPMFQKIGIPRKQAENLDPTGLDFWGLFWEGKLCLITTNIRYQDTTECTDVQAVSVHKRNICH